MKIIKWKNLNWQTRFNWGAFHPDDLRNHCDKDAVVKLDDDTVILKTHYNPKKFWLDSKNKFIQLDYGIGMIVSQEKFSFGRFEAIIKVPEGKYLWPAFWLTGANSWPPEIDIFEGYTNKYGSYFNWLYFWEWFGGKFWRMNSNLHYGPNPKQHKQLKAKSHFLGFKSPHKKYINYAVEFRPDSIKIFYDDKCVRKIDDPAIMMQLRKEKFVVVINNGIQDEHIETSQPSSEMHVLDFKYTPFNNAVIS
jgi:beta-glucanase (GH16 family)